MYRNSLRVKRDFLRADDVSLVPHASSPQQTALSRVFLKQTATYARKITQQNEEVKDEDLGNPRQRFFLRESVRTGR